MKNRYMPAKPNDIDLETMRQMGNTSSLIVDVGRFQSGLTKLEYAAIQIMAGFSGHDKNGPGARVRLSVQLANLLFDELEIDEDK